jgi:hypothetical protein
MTFNFLYNNPADNVFFEPVTFVHSKYFVEEKKPFKIFQREDNLWIYWIYPLRLSRSSCRDPAHALSLEIFR